MRIKVEHSENNMAVSMNYSGGSFYDHAGLIYHNTLAGHPEVVVSCYSNSMSALAHKPVHYVEAEQTPDEPITAQVSIGGQHDDLSTFLHLSLRQAAELRDKLDAIVKAAKRDPRYDNMV